MKAFFIVLVLCVFGVFQLNAQTFGQRIEAEKVFGGYKFTRNGRTLSIKQLANVLEPNVAAYEALKPARTNTTIATILGGAGGFLVGWQLGSAIAGGEPNWIMAGVGAGLIGISIPITAKSNRQALEAVEIYNSSLGNSFYRTYKPQLLIGSTANGVGLSLKF